MGRDTTEDAVAQPAADMLTGANREQAEAWNGESGKHWVEQQERREAMFNRLTPRLLDAASIDPESRVLDIGCGCGGTTREAARRATAGQVLGVDLSQPMLAEAARLAAAEGLARVRFEQADAQTHPFPAESFDLALSRFGVMFFADPTAAFGNIARALRPEGRLSFLCWRTPAENPSIQLPRTILARYTEMPRPAGPGEPGPFSLADAERTAKLLAGAGFTDVDVAPVDEPVRLGPSVADALAYQMTTPVTRSLVASMDEEVVARATEALRDALCEFEGPGGVVFTAAAWLVTARRA